VCVCVISVTGLNKMWWTIFGLAVACVILYCVGVCVVEFFNEFGDAMRDGSSYYSRRWPVRGETKTFLVMEDVDGRFWWIGPPATGQQGAIVAPGKKAPTADRTDVVHYAKNQQMYQLLKRAVKIDGKYFEDECSSSHPIYRFPDHPRRALWTDFKPVPNNLQEAYDQMWGAKRA
jgi:hypothetical protein